MTFFKTKSKRSEYLASDFLKNVKHIFFSFQPNVRQRKKNLEFLKITQTLAIPVENFPFLLELKSENV
jgi:hypothetical protein